MSYAKDYAWVMLGGGDIIKNGETFQEAVHELGLYFEKSNWSVQTLLSFSSVKLVPDVEKYFAPRSEDHKFYGLSHENFVTYRDDYIAKIKSGEINSNDRLLVVVDSHGGVTSELTAKGYHAISTDRDQDGYSKDIDLAELNALFAVAKKKNVKIALFDMSCFSGNTLRLLKRYSNVCVMTATNSTSVAVSTFGADFWSEALKGEDTVENIFLRSRAKNLGSGFPQIGTRAGLYTQGALRLDEIKWDPIVDDIYVEPKARTHDARLRPYRDAWNRLSVLSKDFLKNKRTLIQNNERFSLSPQKTCFEDNRCLTLDMNIFEVMSFNLKDHVSQGINDSGLQRVYPDIESKTDGEKLNLVISLQNFYRDVDFKIMNLRSSDVKNFDKFKRIYFLYYNLLVREIPTEADFIHTERKTYDLLYRQETPDLNPCSDFKL